MIQIETPHNISSKTGFQGAPLTVSAKIFLVIFALVFSFAINKIWFAIICLAIFIFIFNTIRRELICRKSTIVIENNPPDNIRPIEARMLYNSPIDAIGVASVWLYLVAHDFIELEIKEAGAGLLRGESVFKLKKDKDTSVLRSYEKDFLEGIFRDGLEVKTSGLLDDLSSYTQLKDGVKQELQRQDYYYFYRLLPTENGKMVQFKKTPFSFNSLRGMLSFGMGNFMYATKKGRAIWSRVAGFKNYLETVEKEKVAYHADPKKMETIYIDEMMPYALALGVNTGWADELFGWYEAEENSHQVYRTGGLFKLISYIIKNKNGDKR